MGQATESVSAVFAGIVELAIAKGAQSIRDLPGCWEMQIDAEWWVAVNGHAETTPCSHGAEVAPYTAYLEYNGWPAGIVNPKGGIVAAGEAANEGTLLRALEAARGAP
jgi:hypothetical protein